MSTAATIITDEHLFNRHSKTDTGGWHGVQIIQKPSGQLPAAIVTPEVLAQRLPEWNSPASLP